MGLKRFSVLALAALAALAACGRPESRQTAGGPIALASDGPGPAMVVYKSPTCGCCANWVDHVRAAGFRVEVHDTADVTPIKVSYGVPEAGYSCHTALVEGYVIEGHVPADVIQRLLRERPVVLGLAAPGMPAGSPGMEGPVKQRYDIVTFDRQGRMVVYESR